MPSNSCKKTLSEHIKAEALRLGFSACGIARADRIEDNDLFREWLAEGCNGEMKYMENHPEKRSDPRLLVEGTQSIVSVALNYYPQSPLPEGEYQFAWYAYGKDYHDIVRQRLTLLLEYIRQLSPEADGRAFCDTAPVMERYWAWKAGLGWIGKNTQLIIPQAGSCFFLGELFLNIELDYDQPIPDRCGDCERCLHACPGGALQTAGKLDARQCLSYLTIEHRGELPQAMEEVLGNRIYGCDECQKVCPWNRFAIPCKLPEMQPVPEFLTMRKDDWHSLTEDQYRALFKGSAVKRAKYNGLLRNIQAARRGLDKKKPASGETGNG